MKAAGGNITALLVQFAAGDRDAIDAIMPLLYQELRRMAQRHLRNEQRGATLRTTALIHEAYLRLIDQKKDSWQNRAHFLGLASQAMRRIIIDHARARKAHKRGGGQVTVTFDEEIHSQQMLTDDLLQLDAALNELALRSARQAQVVEFSFFGGLTHDEIAVVLGTSTPTIHRDWRLARAWLSRRLRQAD